MENLNAIPALAWLLAHSEYRKSENEEIWKFIGTLPRKMAAEIRAYMKENGRSAMGRTGTKYGLTMVNTEQVSDSIVVTFGAFKNTANTVRFQRIRYEEK